MQNPPTFPKFPSGLTEEELRKEIRRRMAWAEQMGIIKRRKK